MMRSTPRQGRQGPLRRVASTARAAAPDAGAVLDRVLSSDRTIPLGQGHGSSSTVADLEGAIATRNVLRTFHEQLDDLCDWDLTAPENTFRTCHVA